MILFKALLVQSVADAHVVGGEVQHGVQPVVLGIKINGTIRFVSRL